MPIERHDPMKEYLTQVERDFVINTKLKFARILKELGWTQEALALATGISVKSINRWLNTDRPEFMSLPAMCLICRVMGIAPQELLADPMWLEIDSYRFLFVRLWMEEDIEVVELVTKFYLDLKDLLKKAS
jgi:transcriptional regulator with XRE-family HTH domain